MNKNPAYHIVINQEAGTVIEMGRDHFEKMIANSPVKVETLDFLKPQDITARINDLNDSEAPILIGGGDGTIKSVAELCLQSKKSFGILPLGTMNLLARDLNIPVDLSESLSGYAQGVKTVSMDVGMVNHKIFLCCVGLGTMPESAEFREKNRTQSTPILIPRLTVFVLEQIDKVNQRHVKITIDGKSHSLKTAALVVSNNQYMPDPHSGEDMFKRQSLQDGVLGIYSAAPANTWDKIRLMARLRFGNWHKDPVIRDWVGETMSLKSSKEEELLSLDGETVSMRMPLNFWLQEKALDVLVPEAGVQ